MRLWGGRFDGTPDDLMRELNDSFAFDRRLYAVDIRGSTAYAGALLRAGLLTPEEHAAIVDGLAQVKAEFDEGRFVPLPTDEDIHTAVERRLIELIGPAGGKLHTGRSRNDQVALDIRLWAMETIDGIQGQLGMVQAAILKQAAAHLDLIMPGYTHLQPAQPVLYSHWVMRFFWMFERDIERLGDCARRAAVCPLGAGALAGTPFPIDREALAAELGMGAISPNSLDAVSDRDHLAEFLLAAALIGVHASALAEDLILFCGPAYGFIRLSEAYTTGSSLMPQKRNPDALELARGKAGRLLGDLVSLLTVLKGLPSAYNKDLQEDKEPVFDAADTLNALLPVLAGVIETMQPDSAAMRRALDEAMLATDLADHLVGRGMPFREAHQVVGGLVRLAESRGVPLTALTSEDLQAASPLFAADAAATLSFEASVTRRGAPGGTAPQAVAHQIALAQERLSGRMGGG